MTQAISAKHYIFVTSTYISQACSYYLSHLCFPGERSCDVCMYVCMYKMSVSTLFCVSTFYELITKKKLKKNKINARHWNRQLIIKNKTTDKIIHMITLSVYRRYNHPYEHNRTDNNV